jgi:hypothetical protein
MLLVAREFGAKVVGTGVFIASAQPQKKAVDEYKALFQLDQGNDGIPKVSVIA